MSQRGKKPLIGWLKCNVDDALLNQQGWIGFGCVIHDDQEGFVASRNEVLIGLLEPALVEAMSCKKAFYWLKSPRYNKVMVELDA